MHCFSPMTNLQGGSLPVINGVMTYSPFFEWPYNWVNGVISYNPSEGGPSCKVVEENPLGGCDCVYSVYKQHVLPTIHQSQYL